MHGSALATLRRALRSVFRYIVGAIHKHPQPQPGVDVFIIRGTITEPASQAVAYCGGILFNYTLRFAVPFSELPEDFTITGDPVVEALEALLNQVDC